MFLREWLYFDFVIKQATQAGMVTDCTHCFWKRGLAPQDLLGRVPRCLAGLCGVTKISLFAGRLTAPFVQASMRPGMGQIQSIGSKSVRIVATLEQ